MRLQTELNKKLSEAAMLKKELESLKLAMETMNAEKQVTENQLKSKSDKLDTSKERVVSLGNELAAARGRADQLQGELREMSGQLESVQTLLQEKDKVSCYI